MYSSNLIICLFKARCQSKSRR